MIGADRLLGPGLTTEAMAAAVSDTAWLRAMLAFEAAVASAQARLGIIPTAAAEAIVTACVPATFDIAAIGLEAVASASPVVPVVSRLKESLGADLAPYVHFGCTSQDALDTAMMLVARDGVDVLLWELDALADAAADLAFRYRDTPMLARTLLQPAYPVTFGFKAANWLMGVLDARRRLRAVRRECLAVQLGGPVGTMGGFGGKGLELVALVARELALCEPELPWHSNRGRVGELASALSLAGAAGAKIALDILLLSQAEVGEVAEGEPGGSTSMGHKHNSARSILARASFNSLIGQTVVLLSAGAGEHERAAGSLQAEWPALAEALRLSAGTVARSREAVSGLRVDAGRMAANLEFAGAAATATDPAAAAAIVDRALEIFNQEEANH